MAKMTPEEMARKLGMTPTPAKTEPKSDVKPAKPEEKVASRPATNKPEVPKAGEGSEKAKEATKEPKRRTTKPKAAKPKVEETSNRKQNADPFTKVEGKEIKSKRVNLLLKESDYAAWTKAAKEKGVSFTVFVETIVNSYLDR